MSHIFLYIKVKSRFTRSNINLKFTFPRSIWFGTPQRHNDEFMFIFIFTWFAYCVSIITIKAIFIILLWINSKTIGLPLKIISKCHEEVSYVCVLYVNKFVTKNMFLYWRIVKNRRIRPLRKKWVGREIGSFKKMWNKCSNIYIL